MISRNDARVDLVSIIFQLNGILVILVQGFQIIQFNLKCLFKAFCIGRIINFLGLKFCLGSMVHIICIHQSKRSKKLQPYKEVIQFKFHNFRFIFVEALKPAEVRPHILDWPAYSVSNITG